MRRAALAILTVLALSGCGGKYEIEEREIGYIGEARFNPFLAAMRLLEANHYDVVRERGRARLPSRGTVLVLPASSFPDGGATRYRQWIEDGGHLIYLASGSGNRRWDDDYDIWSAISELNDEHPLLAEFGIEIERDSGASPEEMELRNREITVDMSSSIELVTGDSGRRPDVVLEADGGVRLLSLPAGGGRLTVLASADPIRNRYLSNNDHAHLMLGLVELQPSHAVVFIYGQGTTFFAMLRHHAWMALLGLVALIVLWIWKNLPRFGPTLPQVDSGDRQFTEHIEMTGRFLWRHKAPDALLAPLAAHINREIRKRHPHLADSVDDHVEYFVENTDLSREEVSDALLGAATKDPTNMTRTVKNFKTMIEAL